MELAANAHIKELIIVFSSPQYIPKNDDLDILNVEGNKMKIEREKADPLGIEFNPKKSMHKLN